MSTDCKTDWQRYWLMIGAHSDYIAELKHAFYQDESNGLLCWPDGRVAGSRSKSRTITVQYKMRTMPAQCVVWLMHNNELPPPYAIGFVDGNRGNVRIENLYLVGQHVPPASRCNSARRAV